MDTDPYDALPYGGRAVPFSHPDRLAVAALRHGMSPAPSESCRVLELGCAEGANLIPMAYHLDGARFVGVDASSVQLDVARDIAARLGLENLELVHARIEALDPSIGEFDYIVSHGVFSWVSDEVRGRMLDLVRSCLAPGGVAYISFNCAPGWSIRSEMRRALRRAVVGVDDPAQKIARVRELLAMFARSPMRETPYGMLLAEESTRALAHRDAYLVHEYLAEENRAFHFGEVVELAGEHGLVLFEELGTAALDNRVERGLVQGFTETLEDPVRAEELTELLLFRAFRMSLFRRADAPVRSDLDAARGELAERARFASALRPETPRISLEPGVRECFLTASGARVETGSALLKAVLLELGKSWPRGLTQEEVLERALLVLTMRRVLDAPDELADEARSALPRDLLELGALGHLELRLREPPAPTRSFDTPRVGALTRSEAERSPHVTSPLHDVVALDALARRLVRYLDGARSIADLVPIARDLLASEEVVLFDADGAAIEPSRVEEHLPELVRTTIRTLGERGLLV